MKKRARRHQNADSASAIIERNTSRMNVKTGDVVQSAAGRDAGRYFVVIGLADEKHVLLSDGRHRLAEKPKKKKIRHIKRIASLSVETAARSVSPEVTNADIRRALTGIPELRISAMPANSEMTYSESNKR